MYATIRRYEGVESARTNEVVGKVNETLVPQLRKLPGFAGYYLIEAGNGVLSSLGLFETSEQAEESGKLFGLPCRATKMKLPKSASPNIAKRIRFIMAV